MLIRFSEISPHGNRFTLSDAQDPKGLEDIPLTGEGLRTDFVLQRKSDTKVEMKGQIHATIALQCDRCLNNFSFQVDTDFHILFEVFDQNRWNVKEMECSSQDLDTVQLDESQIDVGDTLRQQIILALPAKNLCSGDCKGICGTCGTDLNVSSCSCDQIVPASPFTVLSKLKKNPGKL